MNSALNRLRTLSDGVNQAVTIVCIACILGMLAISFIGFLYTLFTDQALSWTYSLARLFLPWIGLLSSTVALRSGEHVAMTLLMRALPKSLVRVAAIACLIILAGFALALIWYGWEFFSNARQSYMVSAHIQISYKWTTIAVPLTGAIMLIHLCHGFTLLEHFTGHETAIEEALAGDSRETTS
ncbi:TRAP transporter small permease [Marinobacter sp. UBA2688]|uniref:TRAP transporter small permease n=1 Tax=Marinobacter sp. UBA2688 TaxID=1946816 RepID=UPI00257A44A3|nr:TRAP transporter small permease subunit [Marinobacter sp. UBA2688]|tara:strand:+ start:5118 stop:5666 length:549 start_codon:yes stop_codon:yes gene_type:complete